MNPRSLFWGRFKKKTTCLASLHKGMVLFSFAKSTDWFSQIIGFLIKVTYNTQSCCRDKNLAQTGFAAFG